MTVNLKKIVLTLNVILRNTGLFFLLVFFQVFLFENITLTKFEINPGFYVLFVIILSFEVPGWLLLVSSFFMGLIIDVFFDTGGVHAASLLISAFIRPGVLRLLKPRDGYLPDTVPSFKYYGFGWFLKYSLILIFVHNLSYFVFLKFGFAGFGITLLQSVISAITVFVLIFLSLIIFGKNN